MGGWAFDPYGQAWLSRFPRPRLSPYGAGTFRLRQQPPSAARGLSYTRISDKLRPVLGPIATGLEYATIPLTVGERARDWLTRQGAAALGLKAESAPQALIDSILPPDPSEGIHFPLTPAGAIIKGAAGVAGALGQEGIEQFIRQKVTTPAEFLFGKDMTATTPQRYLRAGTRAVGELAADLFLDPLMLGLPKAIVGTAGKALAKGMLGTGRRAIPGVRQYAPEVATALRSAAQAPGAGRAMQRTASILGLTPDTARVAKYMQAGQPLSKARALARGERLAEGIDPVRRVAEKGLTAGMGTHMGLAGVMGIDEFMRQFTAEGMSPEAFEALVGGIGALGMAGTIGMGMRGETLQERERIRRDKDILPAAGYGAGGRVERLPVDEIPDPLQRQGEAYASSLASRILAEGEQAAFAQMGKLPKEYQPWTNQIWSQAQAEAGNIRMGKQFLDRMRQEHPAVIAVSPDGQAEVKTGVSEETGPDGDKRIIQRNEKGEVVAAAQLRLNDQTGKQELATIAGGRAMGVEASIRPLYEKLDELGVERKEHTTVLGAMARRRGAERLYAREVLEGRERPVSPEEAAAIREDFVQAGLADVMALPAYAMHTGMPAQLRRYPPKPGTPSKKTAGPEGQPVAEPLYSQLRRVVSDPKVQVKQPAEYWLAFLRKNWKTGISGEELKYSGLQDWLRQKGTERVTKEQILDYLDTMDVELKENILGRPERAFGNTMNLTEPADIENFLNAQHPGAERIDPDTGRETLEVVQSTQLDGPFGYLIQMGEREDALLDVRPGELYWEDTLGGLYGPFRTIDEARSAAVEEIGAYDPEYGPREGMGQPRHEQYTLPGGKNYREIVVSIPVREVYGERATEIAGEGRWDIYDAIGRHLGVDYAASEAEALQKFNQSGGAKVGYGFREGHYDPDISNAVFHLRVKERTGPNGERILEIEELQSDWAQQGREKGFASEAELEADRVKFRALQDEGTRLADEARDRGEDPLRPRERPTFTDEVIGRDITGVASGHTSIEQFNQAYNLRLSETRLTEADNLQDAIDLVRRELQVATGDALEWSEVTLASKAAEWRAKGDRLEAAEIEVLREYMVESGVRFPQATLAALEEGTVSQSVLDSLQAEVPRETANQSRLRKIEIELNTLDEQWGGDIWALDALAKFEGPSGPTMPGGPWVQNTQKWTELALKRIIKMAADEGFDQVGWLTGDRQNRRYSLSQKVSRLEFVDMPDWGGGRGDFVRLEAWNPQGRKLTGADFEQVARQVKGGSAVAEGLVLPRSELGRVVGKELTRKIQSGNLLEKAVALTQKDLDDYSRIRRKEVNSGFAALTPADVVARDRVYTEVQRRIGMYGDSFDRYTALTSRSRLTGDQAGRLETLEQRILLRDVGRKHIAEGLDLEVGGEGMREYYDRIVPSVAKAIGRRWGVEVKKSEFGYQESALTAKYQYRGPTLTRDQVSELGYRLEAEGAGQQTLSGVRALGEAMEFVPFKEAMEMHGSIELAELAGGKMVADKGVKREPIHAIDIPSEMAEAVRREGFARMAVDAQAAREAEPLPMEEFLLKVSPENSIIRNPEENVWEVEMPDGQTVRWRVGVDKIEIDLEAFEAGYGRKATAEEIQRGAEGVTIPFPNQAVVDIVEGVRPSVPLHEHWHVVKHLGALTSKQRRALEKRFKGDEEAEAWAFAEWMERRTPDTIFERIWDNLVALYQQVTGAPEAVFRAAERGELMGREARRRVGLEAGRGRAGPAFAIKVLALKDDHPLLQKKRGGKVTGAPEGLISGKQLTQLVRKVAKMAEKGEAGRFWYEEAAEYIDRLTQGNKADTEKFLQLLAIYSPEQAVGPNWVDAVQAWDAYKDIGEAEGLQRLEAGEELIVAGKTRSMDRLAEDALFRGKEWKGLKTNSFYGNLGVILFPDRPQNVTVDRHIMRLMGYKTVSPTPGQYTFSEGVFSEAAKAMGWKPWQVQAGAWTTQRGPGRGPASFPEAAAAQLGAVGLEAVPHRESGHPLAALAEQPYEVRERYTREAREAWTNEQGVDEVAESLGLLRHGEAEGPGYYANEFNPGWRVFAQLVQAQGYRKGKPALEASMTKGGLGRLRRWAGMAAAIYHQESAGILRPFATPRKNDSGYLVEMKRVPKRAELAAFRDALPEQARAVLEEGGLVLDYSPEGLLVHNLTVQSWWKGQKITNRDLAKQAVEAVDKAAPPEVQYDVRAFQSYSELVEPAWKKGGFDARQTGKAFAGESPAVQAAFDRALSRVEAVNQRWAEGPPEAVPGTPRYAVGERGVEGRRQAPRGPPREGPSFRNLPPEHQKNLRRWAGKSRVLDAAGDPRVVFHGGRLGKGEEFSIFSLPLEEGRGYHPGPDAGAGYFFTEQVEFAEQFASTGAAFSGDKPFRFARGAHVKPAYLKIENPKVYKSYQGLFTAAKRAGAEFGLSEGGAPLRDALLEKGFDGIKVEHLGYMDWAGEKQGFAPRGRPGPTPVTWVAFHPEQIKSATGNLGTFRGDTADIRYAVGPAPVSPSEGAEGGFPDVAGERKPPGEPPRVETRVQNLEDARAEQKKLGIPTKDLVLARELRRNWTAIDPEIRKAIINWDDEAMIEAAGSRQLTDVEVQAMDAVVRGRLEQKELARLAFLERKGTNQEAEAWRDYAEALAKYVPLERANVNDGSAAGRALAARNRLMQAAQTPDRRFLRKALAELDGLTDKDAEQLVQMFETGDPRLADALRAYSAGFWKKWQTLLRAMLITPSSEIPNIIGNTIVQGVEITDSAVAAGLDWVVSKIRGKPRERFIGEFGAELSGWIEAAPAAMSEFLKERFAGIYKRAWTGTSKPINLERRLEYQVSPFKTKLPRLIATSLDSLGAGDQLFRSIIARGLAKKWAYRLARQQAKRGTSAAEIAASGDEVLFDLFNRPEKYPEVLKKIRSDTARRLFQGKPWKIVEHIRGMERDWPWLAAALPFVRTPANIARYGVLHSPLGFLSPEGRRALWVLLSGKETYRKGGVEHTMTQGEASDIVASRLTGTAIFGVAVLAAKGGKITGNGPSDWDERKALMETGWRPYSFVVEIEGRNYYVPYARFDPVAQVMGVAADVSEMGNTRGAEDLASKAIGSIMENFTDRTYLKGLIDFTEALNDPLRFAGQYAVGIATMHIPRQVARIATAIDPVIRDVRPLDRSIAGLPKRLQNSVIRNIPWASKSLAPRRGPTGEEIVRPGEGLPGALMRTFSPIQVSPERPGRELEKLMADIGYVPGEQKPYITIQGEQIMLEREDLETLSKADRAAAYELRRFMMSPRFTRLPDTVEEGGADSKQGVIRDTFRRHRDYARQAMLRSRRFRRMAMAQLREKRRAG